MNHGSEYKLNQLLHSIRGQLADIVGLCESEVKESLENGDYMEVARISSIKGQAFAAWHSLDIKEA